MDWNRLRTCRVVHRAGSFTKAGQMLNLTQSAVSRQVAAVEAELGGDIFLRNNDGLVPTEMGISFLETIDRMWQALELGLAQLNELKDDPQGPLTLTTTAGFGSAWLSSRMKKFNDRYPNIEVTLLLVDNAELDLRQREADCAIRFQHPTEPRLVRRFIDDYSYHIFGSREYIERRGMPTSLDDLENHQLIVYGDGIGQPPIEKINWLLTEGMPEGMTRKASLRVNSVYGIYRAVEAGLGLAALPFYMSERSAKLIEVLPDIAGPSIPVYFVYPEELGPSRRIAALRDFIIEEIRATWGDLKRQKLA
jgi:DNA-binding transcriptional LysR family regulator